MRRALWISCAWLLASAQVAGAAEICGDMADNDGNGMADEGCYPQLRTGVCESPLSCMDTGWVSWSTGSLHYDVPADIAPRSPYGPELGFRRFYTSMYAPPSTPSSVNRTPLGARWQHNYMSWIDRASPTTLVVHTPNGEDMLAVLVPPIEPSDWDVYKVQKGHHYVWLRQRRSGAREFQLRTLLGDTLVYNTAGQLSEVWDTVVTPGPNKVLITWTTKTTGSVVNTVTDATGMRQLQFNYTPITGTLASVQFQLRTVPNAWTTYHTTSYGYAAGLLSNVTIGGQLAQTHVYTGGQLTQIKDGGGTQIVAFKYSSTRPGETNLVETTNGTVGIELASPRTTCPGKTVLYFNKGSTTSCSADSDCGSGLLCGGKTGAPSSGTCFRAARCLTVETSSGEALVTGVSALGPGTEPCTGACAEMTQYMWNTTGGFAPSVATDALGMTTTTTYEENFGMPTKIVHAANTSGARTVWLTYDPDFPGRIRDIRQRSTIAPQAASCTDTVDSGCMHTRFEYDPATGKLARTTQTGWTSSHIGHIGGFTHVTQHTYDERGRIRSTDGPVAGTNDKTRYEYKEGSDPLSHGFLETRFSHGTIPTLGYAATEVIVQYDFWGNPIDWTTLDGTRSCQTYDVARNYVTKTSEEMSTNPSCAIEHESDLIVRFTRDSALRLTRVMRADGACTIHEYDAKGRLASTKRRDDCNPASPGDREDYVYDSDGLVTEVLTKDAAGQPTRKKLYSYYDSRKLQAIINPVDPTKLATITYDERGVVTELVAEANLGRTSFALDTAYNPRSVTRAAAGTPGATWKMTVDAHGNRTSVSDPDAPASDPTAKELRQTYDDLGRVVRSVSPDQKQVTRSYTPRGGVEAEVDATQTRSFTYDAFGRRLTARYGDGCGAFAPPQLEYAYDAPGAAHPCPITGGCTNLVGRLAYSRVTLICSTDPAHPDGTLDQETWYSYDPAGRLIAEYIRDDNHRADNQAYTWTKGGDLSQVTMPSSAVIGWSYGSAASNSDTDRVTAQWRTAATARVIDQLQWAPFGPLTQYNRMDSIAGSALRTKLAYNLAYRTTSVILEGQNGAGPYYRVALAEDAKGRVTQRDYYPSDPQLPGVFDSYFLYDDQDRVTCESTNPVTTCPASGPTVKNNHSHGFTGAGDRKVLIRGAVTHLVGHMGGTHRVGSVTQTDGAALLRTTAYTHDENLGNRTSETSEELAHAARTFTYDERNNLSIVTGTYPVGNAWHAYHMHSIFDAQNRRVFKAFVDHDTQVQQHWFFYYDPYDRLTEVRYVPSSAMPAIFTTYQLFWVDQLLTTYWQTESVSGATTKRYVSFDETGRPVRMHGWNPSGNSPVVWAINPDAWGIDRTVVGNDVYQPILFAGQYLDRETAVFLDDGSTPYRPGLVHNGFRTYDPFTGSYLQLDPLVHDTWSAYSYADNDPVGKNDPLGLAMFERVCTRGNTKPDPLYPDAVLINGTHCWDQPTGESIGRDPDFRGPTGSLGGTGGTGIPSIPKPPKPPKPTPDRNASSSDDAADEEFCAAQMRKKRVQCEGTFDCATGEIVQQIVKHYGGKWLQKGADAITKELGLGTFPIKIPQAWLNWISHSIQTDVMNYAQCLAKRRT